MINPLYTYIIARFSNIPPMDKILLQAQARVEWEENLRKNPEHVPLTFMFALEEDEWQNNCQNETNAYFQFCLGAEAWKNFDRAMFARTPCLESTTFWRNAHRILAKEWVDSLKDWKARTSELNNQQEETTNV